MHGIWVTQKIRQDAPPSDRSDYKTIELDVFLLRSVDRDDFAVAHCLDVSDRRLAKEPPLLAIELARTLVSHFICRAGCVHTVLQHALSCDT
jgi:hypothetical protein